MATLIQQDFDMFSTIGATINIPHSFADLCRSLARQEGDIRDAGTHSHTIGFRVPLIKYVRGSFKDNTNHFPGLKDAKDIVDHYYTTKDQPRHASGTQY